MLKVYQPIQSVLYTISAFTLSIAVSVHQDTAEQELAEIVTCGHVRPQ